MYEQGAGVPEGAGACTGGGAMIPLIDNHDSFSYNSIS